MVDDASMTLTLTFVTVISSLTLVRIFTTNEIARPLLLSVAGPMAVAFAVRLARLPWTVGFLGALGLQTTVVAWWMKRTSGLAIGTSTPREAVEIMRQAWATIDDLKPPIAPQLGFALMAMLGAWVVAMVADTVAFRLRSPLEALIPSVAILAVSSALSRHVTGQPRVRSAAAVVGAGILHVCVVAVADKGRPRAWFGAVRPRRSSALGGALILAVGVGALVLFGVPRSQLASLTPSLDLRVARDRSNPRIVTSPLVSMRRQLLELSDDEQFSVLSVNDDSSPARAYWRQTALGSFDGTSWTGSGTFSGVGSGADLPPDRDAVGASRITQDFRIEALASTWLPTAYRVTTVAAPNLPTDATLSFDEDTASLITKRVSIEGLAYRTISRPLSASGSEQVRIDDASVADPSMRELPDDFPVRVRALAAELTAAEPTVVGKARALQDYLRTFRYTTDVPAPSSRGALERFLFEDRAGYCEQFSGAFAAMARAVGVPARVAVGYTPGRYDPSDGRFHVTGRNAHAWPEVYVEGTGWLAFEPTPGRGIPGSENVTGVADQDASEGVLPGASSTVPDVAPTVAPSIDNLAPVDPSSTVALPYVPTEPAESRGGLGRMLLFALAGLLAVLAVVGRVPLVDRWRDARAAAAGPERLVERSWSRALRAAHWVGGRVAGTETPLGFARRIGEARVEGSALAVVAELVTAARFGGPGTVTATDAGAAVEASRRWEAAVFATLPRWRRVLHFAGLAG